MSLAVLVYLEHDGKTLHGEMAKLVAKADELARGLGGVAAAALIGNLGEDLRAEVQTLSCREIAIVNDPTLQEYHPGFYRAALSVILQEIKPHVVLFRHSYIGLELAPGLAYQCGASIIPNCLDIEVRDGKISVVRPCLQELCWARISPQGSPPYFFTLQRFPLSADLPASGGDPKVRELPFTPVPGVRIRSRGITQRVEGVDISKSQKIVAVGRGIREKANLKLVEELCEALGASLACSRPIVDLGWLPTERQVGISGKTVRPKVYLACGISGESQHVAGMKDAPLIIAINSDPKAPIFRVAHYGVVADLFAFLPAFTAAALQSREKA